MAASRFTMMKLVPLPRHVLSQRAYSSQKGFFGNLINNIKQEFSKNKEMKESIKKFREDAQKLEQSDALQQVKQKFKSLEDETSRNSQHFKVQLQSLGTKIKEGLEDAQNTDIGKKGRELTSDWAKTVKSTAENIAKQGEELGKTTTFKAVTEGVKIVKKEIDDSQITTGAKIYQAPIKLKKRSERAFHTQKRDIEINLDASSIATTKESRWAENWQKFKDNNPYMNTLFDLKSKYDESENPLVRASRLLTDKMSNLFGNLFQSTDLSLVLTEITKLEPSFEKESFMKECEDEIIPNILEAMSRGDLEILNDWCYEGTYNILADPYKKALELGWQIESKILDINNLELIFGKIMDQGPVLGFNFQAQQIMCVKDAKGKVIEGDADKIMLVQHVWALCRDPTELDPKAAWKLIDIAYKAQSGYM